MDPSRPKGDWTGGSRCAAAMAGEHHSPRRCRRGPTSVGLRHLRNSRARQGPLLRCHLGSANQTRWQPSSWSAGARRGRTCHGSSPQACPLPGARPWRPAPLVCTCCRDRWTLERRFTASCATSRCIASTARSRHVARSRSAGLGKALVGVSGGCCPARGLQCCLRRLDDALTAQRRGGSPHRRGPPPCS